MGFNMNDPFNLGIGQSDDSFSVAQPARSSTGFTGADGKEFDPTWWDKLTGFTSFGSEGQAVKNQGYGAPALGLTQTALSSWLGFSALGQAKDALAFQQDAFNKQYDMQAQQVQHHADYLNEVHQADAEDAAARATNAAPVATTPTQQA